jgi:hypothetical protein
MFDPNELPDLRRVITEAIRRDAGLLEALRTTARGFKSSVRTIQPRSATTISLVASDGGNHSFPMNPFFVQLVRIVDSYGHPLCLDVVTPTTDTDELSKRQFNDDGTPKTALGRMMFDLDVRVLSDLSSAIPTGADVRAAGGDITTGWVTTYRDLCEWATLYERICYQAFPTDTVLVRDGLLRAKYFSGDLFTKLGDLIEAKIAEIRSANRRRVFLVGLAKHSTILDRYGLAFDSEAVFPDGSSCYLEVSRDVEKSVYRWGEYAVGRLDAAEGGEQPKFVNGKMFLARFGKRHGDPIWPIDIFEPQAPSAQEVLGYLLEDAIAGFPVPFYPRSLQLAHEWAEIAGFDADMIGDAMREAVRDVSDASVRAAVDARTLDVRDISSRRYK